MLILFEHFYCFAFDEVTHLFLWRYDAFFFTLKLSVCGDNFKNALRLAKSVFVSIKKERYINGEWWWMKYT